MTTENETNKAAETAMKKRQTTALIILDGWGNGKDYPGNAVMLAKTPTWDKLRRQCPARELIAGGEQVGLPAGQMGNSEVGHTILGAGRIVYQTLLRINRAIADGSLAGNQELRGFLGQVQQAQVGDAATAPGSDTPHLHLMGLLSDGGVHSHQEHLAAILQLAAQQGIKHIKLHLFLDGRDTAPKSAAGFVDFIQRQLDALPGAPAELATVSGRYYAMDRDKRWERTKRAYDAMTASAAAAKEAGIECITDINKKLAECYAAGTTDEFVPPFICGKAAESLRPGQGFIAAQDYVISINFRADRVRQITAALAAEGFDGFTRPFVLPHSQLLCMTDYDPTLPLPYVFGKEAIDRGLGEVISKQGLRQLRLAETEKFAHVTYFFNGGREQPFAGEERELIPSLKVATYDLAPEMRAVEITDKLTAAISSGDYDFILCNYANGDMVGHSGKIDAAVQTVEVLDECLARVAAALEAAGGQALITADHGNCEELLIGDPPKPQTAHTLNPVPLLYYGKRQLVFDGQPGGLADIAPSVLKLMGLEIPAEMTGRALFSFKDG